jgi:hypothetical protein
LKLPRHFTLFRAFPFVDVDVIYWVAVSLDTVHFSIYASPNPSVQRKNHLPSID